MPCLTVIKVTIVMGAGHTLRRFVNSYLNAATAAHSLLPAMQHALPAQKLLRTANDSSSWRHEQHDLCSAGGAVLVRAALGSPLTRDVPKSYSKV